MHRRSPAIIVLLATFLLAPLAPGQSAPEPTPPAASGQKKMRRLLREGTFLDGLRGRLRRDEATGWWSLRPERRPDDWEARNVPYEIVLLPSHRLEDMEQVARATPGGDPLFEVSGEIFVYRTRNFLLVAHAPQLAEQIVEDEPDRQERAPTGTEPILVAEAPDAAAGDVEGADDKGDEGDTIEDIMRELAEAVGPLQYRATAEPGRPEGRPVPEGSVLVNRRGQLDRTGDGAWIFVFDADATGLQDPPLVVMPCLMLQRIEQYVRRTGRNAPLVLNGRVFQYGGRSYVLPTLFRVPRQRTALAP